MSETEKVSNVNCCCSKDLLKRNVKNGIFIPGNKIFCAHTIEEFFSFFSCESLLIVVTTSASAVELSRWKTSYILPHHHVVGIFFALNNFECFLESSHRRHNKRIYINLYYLIAIFEDFKQLCWHIFSCCSKGASTNGK